MYNVMLVDDEPYIIDGMRKIIDWDEYGIQILHTAYDGMAAMHKFQKKRVDIVVTDIRMPRMDGIALIRSIKELDPDTRFIILSGYEDFSYVKEGITLGIENYLLKPINEEEFSFTLLDTIQKIDKDNRTRVKEKSDKDVLKENVLNRWVYGTIDYDELKHRGELLGLKLFEPSYVIAAVRVFESNHENSLARKKEIYHCIMNTCQKCTGTEMQDIIFQDYDGDIVMPFFGSDYQLIREAAHNTMERALSSLKDPNLRMFVALGSLAKNSRDVSKSYMNAKRMLDFSMVLPSHTIIDFVEWTRKLMDAENSQKIEFGPLKKFVISGEKEKAFCCIDDIFKGILKQDTVTPAFLRDAAIEVLYNVVLFTNTQYIKNRHTMKDMEGFFNKVYYMDHTDMLIQYVKGVVEEVVDCILAEKAGIHPLVIRVRNYVQENYMKNISLKTISATFQVNTAYLGQLFKSETGEIFSSFLNRVRIEKAIELFHETHINASEIAIMVGFPNPGYFYSVFKRLTGMSTTEFKRGVSI